MPDQPDDGPACVSWPTHSNSGAGSSGHVCRPTRELAKQFGQTQLRDCYWKIEDPCPLNSAVEARRG